MFRKLGCQLTAGFIVVILLSMAVLGFYLLDQLDKIFTEDTQNSLHQQAQVMANLCSQYYEGGPNMSFQQKRVVYNQCQSMSGQYGSRIRVLDTKQVVIIDSMTDANPVITDRSEVLQALQGEEAQATWLPDQEGEPPRFAVACPIVVSRPTRGGSRRIIAGVVYITRSLKVVRQVLHDLRYHFVVGTLFSLIASGILGVLFSYVLSNPLRRIAMAAERMARGQMGTTVPVTIQPIEAVFSDQNEVGDLARSFNFMASELARRNEELVEERNKLSAVLTHMQGGALMVDMNGHILMRNRSAMTMLGLDKVVNAEQPSIFHTVVERTIAAGVNNSLEIRLPSNRIAQVLSTPVRSESDEMLGFVILINDITELRRLDEMRTEFVSNVSHELRTPLASIKGLAEILLDGALHEEEGKRFLRSINHEINRLTRLVKDLLDLSKIESGMVKFETRPIELGELVSDLLQRMQSRLEGARLETHLPPAGEARAQADPDRVEQVLINLLDNAARYTPPDGLIVISAVPHDGELQVCVENEGSGIPQEELSKIFERFYRIDKHRSRDQGGTGLGLSISRHIVERMGGRIWAESEGKRTRFIFSLPRAPAEPDAGPAGDEPA